MAMPDWWTTVKNIMSREGVDTKTWLPILLAESGGDPTAHNTKYPDDSVGLFQLNRLGGQGMGYTVQQLKSPSINAEIASKYLARGQQVCQRQGNGSIQCVAANSGHPGPVPADDRRIIFIAQLGQAIQSARSDEEAWSLGYARYRQGPGAGGNPGNVPGGPVGPGEPGESGGSWLPSLDWNAVGASLAQGAARQWFGGFLTNPDVKWSVIFWVGGCTLILVGTVGLALQNNVVNAALQLTPQTRAVATGARRAGSAARRVAEATGDAVAVNEASAYLGEAGAVV